MKENATCIIIIVVYVNNIIIIEGSQSMIEEIKNIMKRHFDIKDLGKL